MNIDPSECRTCGDLANQLAAANTTILIIERAQAKVEDRADGLRAELASANTRCAELEAAVEQEITTRDQYADLLDRFAAAIPGDHGEHSSSNDPWTNALASAAALQATLDRISALPKDWKRLRKDDLAAKPAVADAVHWCEKELRAALDDQGRQR